MRLAVVAASSYAASQKLPELGGASLDLDLLGQRLSEVDAGFTVHAFRAERGLAEAIEQVLSETSEPIEALLFFFSGYAVVSDERGPALLLDGERLGTLSIKRLKRLLTERAPRSLAILDTVSAFAAETPPADAIRALAAALHEPGSPLHLFVANRPESNEGERSPFTSLLELVLDWQSGRGPALGADALFGAMRAEESMFAALPGVEYVAGSQPFEVLLGRGGSGVTIPPPDVSTEEAAPELPRLTPEERERALGASTAAEEAGDYPEALAELRIALRGDARDVKALGRALVLSELCGKPDTRWNAACALELLGGANESELELAASHRPTGLLQAQSVVAEADWLANVLCPERDAADEKLVRAFADAAVAAGVERAWRERRLPVLGPATEQDLEKSTTMLARTLVWTARLLGLPRPRLHVFDAVSGDLAVVPTREPMMFASKALGSGLTLPELAFRWARALVYLRPELRLLPLYTHAGELGALARAAVAIVTPNAPRLDTEARLLSRGLKRHLNGPALANLGGILEGSTANSVTARLKGWARSSETLAARAGLLACGNLTLAAKVTEAAPLPGSSAAEQVEDLIAYSLSEEYAALRARLGVAVKD